MKRLLRKFAALAPEQYIPNYQTKYEHINKGIQTINVSDIIGMTYGRHDEYDDNFKPIGEPDERWKRIYEKAKQENSVDFAKPISLIKAPDENKYFVYDDGNHRVSVAKELNIPTIQAEVFILAPKNEELNEILDGIRNEIKIKDNLLKDYTKQQNEIWDDPKISFDVKNVKYDEIEKLKQPLYNEVDSLLKKYEEKIQEYGQNFQ